MKSFLGSKFFIFIGPDKTGSTWLEAQLRRHVDVHVSPAKDTYYFDRYYDKGWAWYESLFSPERKGQVICDISHDYLFSADAAERIENDLPVVKVLTILRSPLERSFSQFLYYYRNGKVDLDFNAALDKHPEILANSQYSRYLPAYRERFTPDQFKVMLFDDLKKSPESFILEVLDFIGVTTDGFDASASAAKVREASAPRNKYLASFLKECAVLLRNLGFAGLVGRVKSSRFVKVFYKDFDQRPVLTDADIDRYKHLFAADIEYLEREFGFDLTRWKYDLRLG